MTLLYIPKYKYTLGRGLFSKRVYFHDRTLIVAATITAFAILIYYALLLAALVNGPFNFTSRVKLGLSNDKITL